MIPDIHARDCQSPNGNRILSTGVYKVNRQDIVNLRKQPRPHDQRPIRKLPGGTCWLGIPKIELSAFVPGPWVVFGASPERRFSHAASTALERLPPVKIIASPVMMQIP